MQVHVVALTTQGGVQATTLSVGAGEVLFVVGPGKKEALLEAVAGTLNREFQLAGGVYFQPAPGTVSGKNVSLDKFVAVVDVDMPFTPGLTVRETLWVAARLKLPHQAAKIEKIVDSMLNELGLDYCANISVGTPWKKGISSGELRRLALAVGMIGGPPVLVLHEPTDKLDSALAVHLIRLLQSNAKREGRTIFASVSHVTSQMFCAMEKVAVISDEGLLKFCGPARKLRDAAAREAVTNSSSGSEDQLGVTGRLSEFDKHFKSQDLTVDVNNAYHSGDCFFRQARCTERWKMREGKTGWNAFRALLLRHRLSVTNTPEVSIAVFIVHLLLALLLGALFFRAAMPVGTLHRHVEMTLSDVVAERVPGIFASINNSGMAHSSDAMAITQNVHYSKLLSNKTSSRLADPGEWVDLFVHGLGNRQPALEALEQGVDGKGSQPLLSILRDVPFRRAVFKWLACVTDNVDVTAAYKQYTGLDGYRTTQVTRELLGAPSESTADSVDQVIVTVARLLQIADFVYSRLPWDEAAPDRMDKVYWEKMSLLMSRFLIDPAFSCAGYPKFSIDGWAEFFAPSEEYDDDLDWEGWEMFNGRRLEGATKRELISIEQQVQDMLDELLLSFGTEGPQLFAETKGFLVKARSCSQPWCLWLDAVAAWFERKGKELADASMATANVLGAIFVFVGTMPSACMHTLLTIPAQRRRLKSEAWLYPPEFLILVQALTELPVLLLSSCVSTALFCWLVGLQGNLWRAAAVGGGVTFAASGFTSLLATAAPTASAAILALPITTVLFMTLAGFLLREGDIPAWVAWLRYGDFLKWGFTGLVCNFYSRGLLERGPWPSSLVLVIAGTDARESQPETAVASLIVLGLLFRGAACLGLRLRAGLKEEIRAAVVAKISK